MDHTKFHYGRDGFRENSAAVIRDPKYIYSLLYIYIHTYTSRLSVSSKMTKILPLLASIAVLTVVVAGGQSLDDCLQSDSISCVQKSLYRKAKEFFDKDSLELFTGVSLVKNEQGRGSRSGKELMYEQEIDAANSVTDRQNALENFVSEEAGQLLTGRSLRVNSSK